MAPGALWVKMSQSGRARTTCPVNAVSEPTPSDDRTQKSDPAARLFGLDGPGPRLVGAQLPAMIGRFEIRAVLGEGAFGRVYRAFDPDLHRDVAIKIPKVPPGQVLSQEFRDRFLIEARAAATIHHPNVCPVYEVGTEDNVPYIVMHFVPGDTLAKILAARRQTGLSQQHAAAIVRKLALGVAAAHAKKVIHRDLKPQNIIWDEATREVLITDFGLARVGGDNHMTATGAVMGTPLYMAPEQMAGDTARVGPPADVYALGVILYEHLVGQTPFHGSFGEIMGQKLFRNYPPPAIARPGIDARLNELCMDALIPVPEQRTRSAKELAAALAEYLRGATTGRPSEPVAGGDNDLVYAVEVVEPPKPAPPVLSPDTLELVSETWRTNPPGGGTEVLVCPRCKARMEVREGRTKPVECPLCRCTFSMGAGRQAASRQATPQPVTWPEARTGPRPVARPVAPNEPRARGPARRGRRRGDQPLPTEGEQPARRRRSLFVTCCCLPLVILIGAFLGLGGVLWVSDHEDWQKSLPSWFGGTPSRSQPTSPSKHDPIPPGEAPLGTAPDFGDEPPKPPGKAPPPKGGDADTKKPGGRGSAPKKMKGD